jgi:hypothetical protein
VQHPTIAAQDYLDVFSKLLEELYTGVMGHHSETVCRICIPILHSNVAH